MFSKGVRVQVNEYRRLRTSYLNAEVQPGQWFNMPGYTGVIDDIYYDTDEPTYVVKSDPRRLPDGSFDITYNEHPANELNELA